jgi:DNA anti-recombination protein RmuC
MVKLQYERNKHVKEISKQLTSLGKHFEIFAKDWEALSKQLDTATRTRERLDSRVTKITDRFDDISSNNQITTQDIPELE